MWCSFVMKNTEKKLANASFNDNGNMFPRNRRKELGVINNNDNESIYTYSTSKSDKGNFMFATIVIIQTAFYEQQ